MNISHALVAPVAVVHKSVYGAYVLALLAAINVSSYMDRTIISILAPSIKAEMGISDTLWGVVAGMAFAIPYALAGIPLAQLADRWSRRGVLALAVSLWSGMTALCGFAANWVQLVLGRMGVGVGEAANLPAAQGIIAGYYPPEKRSGALAFHSAGIAAGSMLGLVLGGWIGHVFGWRTAFVALGAPGLVLALLVGLTLRDPPTRSPATTTEPSSNFGLFDLIRSRPSYLHLVMVFGSGTFFAAAALAWLPSFYVREYEFSIAATGLSYGLITGVASIVGVLLGGWFGNRLHDRGPRRLIQFAILTDLVTLLFVVLLLVAPSAQWSLGFNFLASATGMMGHGILFSLVQSIAPDHLRSRASSLLVVASAVVGLSGGPLLVGFLSDQFQWFAGAGSLRYALLATTVFCLWPIFHFFRAMRTIDADVLERRHDIA